MLMRKNFITMLYAIGFLLVAILGGQLVVNCFNILPVISDEPLQTNKLSSSKNYLEESNQPISQPAGSGSHLPLVLNTQSISDQVNRERISQAREIYKNGSRREKIQALHLLMHISPVDASAILHELLAAPEKTKESLSFIRHLMAGLSEEKAYLQDADIKSIHALNDPVAQKIAAIVLAERGDNSLTEDYIKSRASKLDSHNSKERSLALKEIGSVGFSSANTYFINALKDPDPDIKIQAIQHLMLYGNNSNIADIEKLMQDTNPSVVQQAEKAIDLLWDKSVDNELPLSRRLMQPGFPVNGLVPD